MRTVPQQRWVLLACAAILGVGAAVAACSINPQPLPPGDDNGSGGNPTGGAQTANPPSDNGSSSGGSTGVNGDGGATKCDNDADASCGDSGDVE